MAHRITLGQFAAKVDRLVAIVARGFEQLRGQMRDGSATVHAAQIWWALVDSSHGPHPYQGCALTT